MRKLAILLTFGATLLLSLDAAAQERGDRGRGRSGRPDGMSPGGGPFDRGSGRGGPPGMGFQGGGPPGMGFRGEGPPGMGPPGGGNDEDRASRFEGFLRSMDANGDGVLQPSEIPEERRRILGFLAGRLGIDPGQPIAISRVRETVMQHSHGGERPPGPGEPKEESKSKPSEEPAPLVPGFGVEQELPRVPAFGERVDLASLYSSSSSSKGPSPARSHGDRGSRGGGIAEYALRRYDRNHSGALEKDEWAGMPTDPSPADRNRDGVITLDELTTALAERSRGHSDEPGRDSRGPGESGRSSSAASIDRKSYRFLTSAERLLEGLPDWFTRSDANKDGQVAMAEYSSYWSDSKVREFRRYDLNEDGLITPRECLDAKPSDELAGAAVKPSSAAAGGASESPKQEGGSTAWWLAK